MKTRMSITAVALLALAACGDNTGPTMGAQVSLSFASGVAAGAGAAPSFAGPMAAPSTDNVGNTLEITKVQVVLREIEFERVEVADCDLDPDDCEKFETGPVLIDLRLDGTLTDPNLDVAIGVGTYDELEFDIHKLSNDDPEDAAFLSANSAENMEGLSIRVRGFYTPFDGQEAPFTYVSDLNEEQELPMDLVIDEDGASTNVTIVLEVDAWFRDGNGDFFDPATALKGEPNENLAIDNIRNSLEAFEDKDEDGAP